MVFEIIQIIFGIVLYSFRIYILKMDVLRRFIELKNGRNI